MILVTTDTIPGKEIKESLGIVKGQVVQSKHIGRDFMAGLKTIVGGEIEGYTEMIAEAVVARKLETTAHEIMKSVHAHPTMAEAIMEAVEDAYGHAIHI